MAKKERNQTVVISDEPVIEIPTEEEQILEADAYGSPKLDAGADVTVTKPVGVGGPVPIVAPKHTTIQLQPIVVPLAVVPYMTSDSNVLRTDNKQASQYQQYQEEDGGIAPTFDTAVQKKKKAKSTRKISARIFSLISFLAFGVFFIPFILAHFNAQVGTLNILQFDIIGIISTWIKEGFSFDAILLIYILVAVLSGIGAIVNLIAVLVGKYPKGPSGIFSFVNMISFIGLIIYWSVIKTFVLANSVAFVVLLTIACFTFVLSIVGSIVVSHFEDNEDRTARVSEI